MTMNEYEKNYPLQWPVGRPRTRSRVPARFYGTAEQQYQTFENGQRVTKYRQVTRQTTISEAIKRLDTELSRLGATYPVLSSNLELRLDGTPRGAQKEPNDPGVAIYFNLNKRRIALSCDKWNRTADNIVALAKHIEAMRGQERWGVGTIEQAFAGYAKLPSPEQARQWRAVLGIDEHKHVTRDDVERRFRHLATIHHPDVTGGSHDQMAQINEARRQALMELGA
jgi:hypothetical protein